VEVAYGEVESMQHEPIGDIDSDCKQAKFTNGSDINKEPDDRQG
jgi:hypothetical protein